MDLNGLFLLPLLWALFFTPAPLTAPQQSCFFSLPVPPSATQPLYQEYAALSPQDEVAAAATLLLRHLRSWRCLQGLPTVSMQLIQKLAPNFRSSNTHTVDRPPTQHAHHQYTPSHHISLQFTRNTHTTSKIFTPACSTKIPTHCTPRSQKPKFKTLFTPYHQSSQAHSIQYHKY